MSRRGQRQAYLEEDLLPWLRDLFASRPHLRSALFLVSQFWNDQADDEVHASVVFSPRETPRWPHVCPRDPYGDDADQPIPPDADTCDACEAQDYVPFHGMATSIIEAFQPICHEHGNQSAEPAENYLPCAVIRRGAGDAFEIEHVGRIVRGWAELHRDRLQIAVPDALLRAVYAAPFDDAPRHVLADVLQQRGDPRGDFIELSLAGAPEAEPLLAAHREAWLGTLATRVSDEGLVFRRGFPAEAQAFFSSEEDASDEAWATIERLRLMPGSVDHVPPAARGLREVGPLGTLGLRALAACWTPACERLHVAGDDEDAFAQIPRVRALRVSGAVRPGSLGRVAERLLELELATLDPEIMRAWLGERARPPTLSFCADDESRDAAGFRVSFGREPVAHVAMAGFSAAATIAALGAALARLPIDRVVVRASRLWRPTADEVAELASACGRPVGLE
jgi:uncharacterized protein (TIGR02996 family)